MGKPFYLLSGKFIDTDRNRAETDNYWLDRNYVTVVPTRPDPTALDQIDHIERLLK